MHQRSPNQTNSSPNSAFTPVHAGLLQRKCTCGNSVGLTGKCSECENKQLLVQRQASHQEQPSEVPAIVHEVLHSAGQPLDSNTRAFMESRFQHDFSQVRVHTDAKAIKSAQEVNALAYTTGQNIVFNTGQYEPDHPQGLQLLAHELTHVVQQRHSPQTANHPLKLDAPTELAEAEADRVGAAVVMGKSATLSHQTSTPQIQRKSPAENYLRQLVGGTDPIHQPLIEEYRRQQGLPPGGVDEFGNRVGPSDAEIKYTGLVAPTTYPCPPVPGAETVETRGVLRDALCFSEESLSALPSCTFTKAHLNFLASATAEAKERVQRAYERATGGSAVQSLIREQANLLFADDIPPVKRIIQVLTDVQNVMLGGNVKFAGKTCGEKTCQKPGVVAYVTAAGRMPIYVCPLAYVRDDFYRTVIHEAVHITGIDADPATPEGYCDEKLNCNSPCLGQDSADAWAHFISCLGAPIRLRRSFTPEIKRSVENL